MIETIRRLIFTNNLKEFDSDITKEVFYDIKDDLDQYAIKIQKWYRNTLYNRRNLKLQNINSKISKKNKKKKKKSLNLS